MKKAIIICLWIMGCINLSAQTTSDQNTIRDNLRFYYVADIQSSTYSPELLDNAAIIAGTESGNFWTNTAMAGPQNMVRALLKGRGGDADMQRIAAKILRILNKPVKVNLLNDSRDTVNAVTTLRYGACKGDNAKSWPCAINMTISDDFAQECARRLGATVPARRDPVWAGSVCMGTAYFGSSNYAQKFSTILHEMVHTQDKSDGRGHLFWVNGRRYRYGADDTHYSTEAIPNRAITYQEGIANAIRLMYDGNRLNEMFTWFASNGDMLVERALSLEGTGPGAVHVCFDVMAPSRDVWLHNQLIAANVRPRAQTADRRYSIFSIRSLPPRFIAHNEYILAMIGEKYVQHVSINRFFRALSAVNAQSSRTSMSTYAYLFKVLCDQAIPTGVTFTSLQVSVPAGSPMPYLYPLALVDYFTGYRATTLAEFRDIFENQSYMDDWTALYWNNGKDVVRTRVPMGGTLVSSNLTDIAISLGITTSIAD